MKHSCSLLIQDQEGRYLLIQRSAECTCCAGEWEFPGGKRDDNESSYSAMLREVQEEIGVTLSLPFIEPPRNVRVQNAPLEYHFFSWTLPSSGQGDLLGNPIRLSHEHSAFVWVTFDEARALPMVQAHREFMEWHWVNHQLGHHGQQNLA